MVKVQGNAVPEPPVVEIQGCRTLNFIKGSVGHKHLFGVPKLTYSSVRHLWCSTDCLNSLAEWLSCCCGVWYKVTSEGHKSVNHHADKVLFDELQHALDVCDFSSDEKKVCITSSTSATCYTCHGSICRSNVNHIFIHRSVCALHYITLHFLTWPK